MHLRNALVVTALALLMAGPAWALTSFSDGFEGYVSGFNALDANYVGPNQGPNGGWNPWFGPAVPNLYVLGTTGGVSPHSGSNMVTAHYPSDFDQDWVNLAARTNGGNAITGSIAADWWFYDPSGAGGTNYRDYAALGYYTLAAGTGSLDYGSDSNINHGGCYQRLSLGASNPTGYDANMYQARVVGATDGLGGGSWFNVGSRSVGWHEGKIVLGADSGASTVVTFYIDGIPVLTHDIMTANGVNVFELNNGFGSVPGYFDDVSITPEPATLALLVAGFGLMGLRRR